MQKEMIEVQYHTELFKEKQRLKANTDAVGVFFTFIPLGSVFGEDVESQYAIRKGRANSLIPCNGTKELW